jgi:hypothetical protein
MFRLSYHPQPYPEHISDERASPQWDTFPMRHYGYGIKEEGEKQSERVQSCHFTDPSPRNKRYEEQ